MEFNALSTGVSKPNVQVTLFDHLSNQINHLIQNKSLGLCTNKRQRAEQ